MCEKFAMCVGDMFLMSDKKSRYRCYARPRWPLVTHRMDQWLAPLQVRLTTSRCGYLWTSWMEFDVCVCV
jgi:hypothetical protein